ncbi:hypothetical protein PR048_033158 [Dryococelus australis]|uniref:Reverse transcriptase n=1 Tax=Dryococelus australis TaxID=614101 RepID=A0ABQ9G0F2_9NEOP|nr:hypothetical protein PR048_033158 [Dryococelus australis]
MKKSGRLLTSQSCEPMRAKRGEMEQSRMQGRGEREIPEKTRRPAASSGTIPTSENPGVARPGIQPKRIGNLPMQDRGPHVARGPSRVPPVRTLRKLAGKYARGVCEAGVCFKCRPGRDPMRVIEVSMELRRNERAGETGDPRESPPTDSIVRHDSHLRKSGVTRVDWLNYFLTRGLKGLMERGNTDKDEITEERTRPQLYLSLQDGGLSLINHVLKCETLYQSSAIGTILRPEDISAALQKMMWSEVRRMPLQYRQAKEALATLVEHLPEGTVASARYLYIRASKTSAVIPSVVNRTPTIRWRRPWKILADPNLSSDLRAAAFGFYNNIVTTQQRKYSIHLTADPACPLCGNTDTALHRYILHAIGFLLDHSKPVTVQDFVQLLRQDRWNMARRGTLRHEYGASPELMGGGNGRSRRKLADQWHRPAPRARQVTRVFSPPASDHRLKIRWTAYSSSAHVPNFDLPQFYTTVKVTWSTVMKTCWQVSSSMLGHGDWLCAASEIVLPQSSVYASDVTRADTFRPAHSKHSGPRELGSDRRGTSGTFLGDLLEAAKFATLVPVLPPRPMRVTEVNTERRRNEGAGETGVPRENPPTNAIVRHDSHLPKSDWMKRFDWISTTRSWEPMRVERGEYRAAPECKGVGNGRCPRKPADQRHDPRVRPRRESSPVRLGGKRVI